MKNLQLSLKTKWFEMTKAGIKTEDYRDITNFWVIRLSEPRTDLNSKIDFFHHGIARVFKKFTQNTITLGYPKKGDTERILKFEHAGIEIREGSPEWGAEPGKVYFVIKHGKQIL